MSAGLVVDEEMLRARLLASEQITSDACDVVRAVIPQEIARYTDTLSEQVFIGMNSQRIHSEHSREDCARSTRQSKIRNDVVAKKTAREFACGIHKTGREVRRYEDATVGTVLSTRNSGEIVGTRQKEMQDQFIQQQKATEQLQKPFEDMQNKERETSMRTSRSEKLTKFIAKMEKMQEQLNKLTKQLYLTGRSTGNNIFSNT